MQLTDSEKRMVAYSRAYVQNKTKRKLALTGGAMLLALIVLIIVMNNIDASWLAILGFAIIASVPAAGYFIRKPEKHIAEQILKEG